MSPVAAQPPIHVAAVGQDGRYSYVIHYTPQRRVISRSMSLLPAWSLLYTYDRGCGTRRFSRLNLCLYLIDTKKYTTLLFGYVY